MDTNNIQKAILFATQSHGSQKRKDGTTPYVLHPMMVAFLCAKYGLDDEVIASALLHDVVEDTPVTLSELQQHFSERICKFVDALTLKKGQSKEKYLASFPHHLYEVRCIKVADRIHNLRESDQMGPAWKKKYLDSTVKYLVPASIDTPLHDELMEEVRRVNLETNI